MGEFLLASRIFLIGYWTCFLGETCQIQIDLKSKIKLSNVVILPFPIIFVLSLQMSEVIAIKNLFYLFLLRRQKSELVVCSFFNIPCCFCSNWLLNDDIYRQVMKGQQKIAFNSFKIYPTRLILTKKLTETGQRGLFCFFLAGWRWIVLADLATGAPFLQSPEDFSFGHVKPFLKRLVFSYVVKGIKIKTIEKFRASRRLRFEDTKRIKSPEMRPKRFGTFEKRAPGQERKMTTGERAR